jgi:type II secretory pathway component GspD/PulD (secretin)
MRPTILAGKVAEAWKDEFRLQQGRQHIEIVYRETSKILSRKITVNDQRNTGTVHHETSDKILRQFTAKLPTK